MNFHDLIPVLQVAIGPVILISGVGLLLLSMTNRYGRAIDRSRHLCESLRTSPDRHSARAKQLDVLLRRAKLIRASIALASGSVLLAALLIITLFLAALFKLELAALLVFLFVACLSCLIASLVIFILDINVSLAALKLEINSRNDSAD